MITKRIISILTTLCIIASCFTGVLSASAEDVVLKPISTETVCEAILSTDSTINVTATQEEGYVGVAITSELLKKHKNGEEILGHWAGFAVVAPEGATHLKYAFGTSDEIALSEAYELTDEDVVTADGKKGIAFYADAGSNDAKTHAKLQWFSDETTAMSAETTFVMNLDGINLDGIAKEDVEIWGLDKKSGYVNLYGIQHDDDVSVDFSKIKMEYGFADIDLKTEFDLANVADFDSDDAVYDEGSYKVELINEYEICITMQNLVMHTNGNGDEGHWTGFSVKAPEDAKYLTYWKTFGNNSCDYQTITFEEGQTEESFYLNVTECDTIEEIELQWFDENHSPLSDCEWYEIDLSNVEIAAESEVTFEAANVCDSFPGANAPAKVYEDYSVELDGNTIKIAMTDLVLHRNANKEPGYWTGFTVNVPEGTRKLMYNKTFGENSYSDQTITLEEGQTSESFYFDAYDYRWYSDREVRLQFLDENGIPLTREMLYEIDIADVEIKYPKENTITKANVADFDSDESVYEEYDVACEWDTIELSATNLKAHTNGNGDEGHWIGFSVEAPEGATHYTYDFGNSFKDVPVALDDGETSVSFYVNASSPDAKDYLEIRWYCDEDEPESYPYTHAYDYCSYYIDLTNVDLADDVSVDVTAANIVNQNAPESAPYTGTPSATVEGGTIKLAVENLKTHFNGNSDLGAWVGASISRPSNAAYVKYVFDDEYAWWGSANYEPADEVSDENAISFYVDAYDESPKNTIMLQWFDENEVAITNILTYELDLSDVDYLVADEAEVSFEKANIVDQDDPDEPAYVGKYDVNVEGDTIKLSADCIKYHMNAEDNWGNWIGFKASVEGAKYLKYVFENDDWYYDWYNANQIEISDSESFYVDASDYDSKNIVMLQWFDENGNALTNVNTYKIDIEKVTTEDSFPVLFSNIELTGSDARFYNLVPNDECVEWVSNADYVYVLTFAGANGSVVLTVNGTDESNGGNVFYRDENKTVTLTATPNSGYVFNGWYDTRTGNNVSNTASYEIALDACYELEARFKTSSSGRPSSGGGGVYIATPAASVLAGEVETGTKVELSTKTADAVIYYTVDGTTPSADSKMYNGAITITEDTLIKAIAIKGKTKSSVLTVKYTVKKSEENSDTKAPVFTDIANYAWANEAIVALAEKGIIKGVSDTEFAPAKDIKRADFILLLVRMLNLKADVTSNFDDVSADKYYYEGVGIAKAFGLTTGVGNNKFNPEASITRQDMFVLVYRILQMQKADLIDADESVINAFDDYSKIASYAIEGIASLVKNELVKGSGNKINPVGNATRAETAVFIYRLYNLFNK